MRDEGNGRVWSRLTRRIRDAGDTKIRGSVDYSDERLRRQGEVLLCVCGCSAGYRGVVHVRLGAVRVRRCKREDEMRVRMRMRKVYAMSKICARLEI